MAATSANGWPVIFDQNETKTWVIPVGKGAARHIILAPSSPGFVLVHLALWFHDNVEPLNQGQWDEWGWAVRPIRGQTSGYSNHASGTAEDLNATKHPQGVAGTFTKAQKDKVRARLEDVYDGCIRWGEEWASPDGMHFELYKPRREVAALAHKLRDTPRGKRIIEANQ